MFYHPVISFYNLLTGLITHFFWGFAYPLSSFAYEGGVLAEQPLLVCDYPAPCNKHMPFKYGTSILNKNI